MKNYLYILLCTVFILSCSPVKVQKQTTPEKDTLSISDVKSLIEEQQKLDRLNLLEERMLIIGITEEKTEKGTRYGYGVGILMDNTGLVVTAGHVAGIAKSVDDVTINGLTFTEPVHPLRIIVHPELDIAIMRIETDGISLTEPLMISTMFKVSMSGLYVPRFDLNAKKKEDAFTFQMGAVTNKIIADFRDGYKNQPCFIVEIPIQQGQSGSPAFDRWGNLAGIVIGNNKLNKEIGIVLSTEATFRGLVDLLEQEQILYNPVQ